MHLDCRIPVAKKICIELLLLTPKTNLVLLLYMHSNRLSKHRIKRHLELSYAEMMTNSRIDFGPLSVEQG